jgi:hypothetical protein
MKSILVKSAAVLAIAALSVTSAQAEKYKRVKKQDQFLELVQDKKLLGRGGYFTVFADGTSTGKFEPGIYSVTWEWKGKYMCREGKMGDRDLARNCLKVETNGEMMRFTRDKGKGRVSEWTFE